MGLTDFCVAIRNGVPAAVIHISSKDEYATIFPNVEFKDITEDVNDRYILGKVEQLATVCGYEFLGLTQDNEYAVEISRGDWKHDHIYFDMLMHECFNATHVKTITTEENGGDAYSAKRFYVIPE